MKKFNTDFTFPARECLYDKNKLPLIISGEPSEVADCAIEIMVSLLTRGNCDFVQNMVAARKSNKEGILHDFGIVLPDLVARRFCPAQPQPPRWLGTAVEIRRWLCSGVDGIDYKLQDWQIPSTWAFNCLTLPTAK